MRVLFNPSGAELAKNNAVVSGRSRVHDVHEFEGTLSIKAVLRGSAVWESEGKRFKVDAGVFAVLNHGQTYNLLIRSKEMTETFCVFFAPGYIESIRGSLVQRQLEPNYSDLPPCWLRIGLGRKSPNLESALSTLRKIAVEDDLGSWAGEEAFIQVAKALLLEEKETADSYRRLPAAKASTREQIFVQLTRGKEFMLDSYHQRLDLRLVAEAAYMSPQHFHEVFTKAFGETPHTFVTRRRLSVAQHLLRVRGLSVADARAQVGFESASSFSKVYMRSFGRLPSDDCRNSEDWTTAD